MGLDVKCDRDGVVDVGRCQGSFFIKPGKLFNWKLLNALITVDLGGKTGIGGDIVPTCHSMTLLLCYLH